MSHENRGRDSSVAVQTKKEQDCLEPPEAQRIKEEYFPRSLGRSMTLITFDFTLQSLRTVRE